MTRLVRCLSERNLAVGTIKHDGHDFDLDREGTDSWRHRAAGARASAVFSSRRWAIFRDGEPELEMFVELMADMDLILVEGLKGSSWPKIVLYKEEGESLPAAEPILAVVSPGPGPEGLACPCFRPDEVEVVANLICNVCDGDMKGSKTIPHPFHS